MKKMIQKAKKNNKGFSLVELIIVIAIMAILIGILAPQFIKYVDRSRQSTDVKNIQEVITAIQTYAADEEATTALASGTVVFKYNTDMTTTGDGVAAALTSANLKGCKIKSKNWTNTTNNITLTVTVTNGTPSFTIDDAKLAAKADVTVTP